MSYKERFRWLQGKKVVICEDNAQRFSILSQFLKNYGVEVVAFNNQTAMLTEIESRRYSTHRSYLAIFIAANLAKVMEPYWAEVTYMNPTILQTPVILMGSETEKESVQNLIALGYFKYISPDPMTARFVLRIVRSLNRWKAMRGDITPTAILQK